MLVDVDVDPVGRTACVVGPDVALRESDEVDRLQRKPVAAIRTGLRIREVLLHALDGAGPSLHVRGRAVVTLVRAARDAHVCARAVLHAFTFPSSSPGASTPFSSRIVSTEKSQRS